MRRWLWILGGALILGGVGGLGWGSSVQGSPWQIAQRMGPGMGRGMGPGMMGGGPMGRQGPQSFASNGERIYYTGVSERAGPIPRAGGPMWIRMMGGGCGACHGPDGRGGVPVMMGTAIPADIRYEALTKGEYEHGKKETAYTDSLIKRAITEGLDPDAEPLDWTMPRWQMSDADFTDLLVYLKTLQ